MPLRIHLIIIALITVAMFLGWQLMKPAPVAPAADAPSDRMIEIIRATWGLNCLDLYFKDNAGASKTPTTPGNYADAGGPPALRENNVLTPVSALCNGKVSCAVRNASATFGPDPAPACYSKQLVIEYRCFSYDRLWKIETPADDTAQIDCTRQPGPQ